MSTPIENRVVRMEFDNARFERNIKTTSDTLDKFNDKLKFKDAQKGFDSIEKDLDKFNSGSEKKCSNIKKSLSGIGDAISKITVDPLSNGLETVKMKFSALQVAGATAVSKITSDIMNAGKRIEQSTFGQIMSGGKSRALNIENAKFKIEGLNKDWDALYKDMSYAVDGTAYGIDQAANAAAQFAASGIEAGEDMKAALRGISGVAAMTGASYDDIADVFTSAAGKGRVQQLELQRLASRGINVSAALAEQLTKTGNGVKVTEADIREMTKNGELDFKTFALAMNDAFGNQATKANDTFQGALMNTKAALSRIGEPFYTGLHENLRLGMLELMPVINKFKNAIAPKDKNGIKKDSIMGLATQGMEFLRTKFVDTMKTIEKSNKIENFINKIATTGSKNFGHFKTAVNETLSIFKNFKSILNEIISPFKSSASAAFENVNVFEKISSALTKINEVSSKTISYIHNLFNGKDVNGHSEPYLKWIFDSIFTSASFLLKVLKRIGSAAKVLISDVAPIAQSVIKILSKAAVNVSSFLDSIAKSEKTRILIEYLSRAHDKLIESIKNLKNTKIAHWFRDAGDTIKNTILPPIEALKNGLKTFSDKLFSVMDKSFRIEKPLDNIKEKAKAAKEDIKDLTETSGAIDIWGPLSSLFEKIKNGVKTAKETIKTFLENIRDSIKSFLNPEQEAQTTQKKDDAVLAPFLENLIKFKNNVLLTLGKILKPVKQIINNILTSFSQFQDSFKDKIKNGDFDKIITTLSNSFASGGLGYFLIKFAKASENISNNFKGVNKSFSVFQTAFGDFGNVAKSLSGLINTISKQQAGRLKKASKTLRSFAIAIALIAGSLFLLSTISIDKLAATTILIGEMIGVFVAMSKNSTKMENVDLTMFTKAIKQLGSALVSLGFGLKIMDSISAKGIIKSAATLLGFSGVVILLGEITKDLDKIQLNKLTKSLKHLAFSLIYFSISAKIFEFVSWEGIIKSIVGLTAFSVALSIIAALSSDMNKMNLKVLNKSLKSLAKSFLLFSITFKIFDTVSWGGILKGAVGLAAFTLIIEVITEISTNLNRTNLNTLNKSLKSLAISFILFSIAVKVMDKISWGGLIRAITAFTTFSLLLKFLPAIDSDKVKKLNQGLKVVSKFLNGLGFSFILIGFAAKMIDQLSWETFGKLGIIAAGLIVIVAAFVGLSKKAEPKAIKGIIRSLISIIVVSMLLSAVMKSFKDISWEDMGKTLAGISGLFLILAGTGKLISVLKVETALNKFSNALLKMGAALAIAGMGIWSFVKAWALIETASLTTDSLKKAVTSMFSLLPGILKGFIHTIADVIVTLFIGVFETAASRGAELMSAIGKFVKTFITAISSVAGNFNPMDLIGTLVSLSIIYAMFLMLTKIAQNYKEAFKGLGIVAIMMGLMTVAFTAMLAFGKGNDILLAATGIAEGIAAITALMYAIYGIGKLGGEGIVKTIMPGAKALLITIGIAVAVIAVAGLLINLIDSMTGGQGTKTVVSGLKILKTIFTGIGEIIGGFIGGIASGALEELGTGLSGFMKNSKDFIEGAKKIDPSSMDAVGKMAGAIAGLLGGTLLNTMSKGLDNPLTLLPGFLGALADAFTDSPLVKMGKELSEFAPYMVSFAKEASKIKNPKNIEQVCEAIGKSIGHLEKNIPYEVNAFWGLFSVKKTALSDFGKQMKEFAPLFVDFSKTIAKAKAGNDLVTKCKNIGLMIKHLQENLPWNVEAFWDFWGMKGSVDVHQTPLNEYGEQMRAFSETFVDFANNISGINNDAFTKAERIATMIATISSSMGTETTVATWLGVFDQHKQSLTNFAYDLNNASEDFKTFITTMGGIKTDDVDLSSVDTIVSIITKFSNFQKDNAEWEPGPLIEFFAGKKETLKDFASNLALAVPVFRTIGTSIAKDEWATIKDSQLTSVETTMSAIKSFIEALPDDDMKKKIEKWSKIGVNDINLQNLADVMFGWDKAVYNFDGTRATEWHGNEWVDANKRIPGFIDIISETSKQINEITEVTDTTKFTDISTAINKIFDIIKIFTDKDSKIDLNASDTKTKIENFSAWVKAAGDGLIEAVSMIKGANQFSQEGKIDETDFNVFSQVVDAITKVFESWDKFATTTNTDGNLGTAITTALAAISPVISKFKEFSSDVDKDKAQKVLDWFNVFLKGFGDFDDKKIAKIDKVNTAFANLAGSAFNIAEKTELGTDQTGDGGVAYQINKLSTHYNNIILKALGKSQDELKTGYLNSKQISTTYPLLETLLKKLSGNVDNKKNALYNKIVAIENAAYDKLYSYTHTNNGHTGDHNFEKIGKYIDDGMAFGINTNMQVVRNAANQLGEEALKAAMERLKISSPSKEFEEIGMYSTAGYIIGMTSMTGELKKTTAKTFGDTLTTATQTVTAQLTKAGKDTANKGFRTFYKNGVEMVEAWAKLEGGNYSPTIAPVVDSSKLDKKYATISTASLSLDMDSKSVKQLSSLSASFDAKNEQKIQVDNGDVVKAVNNLDKRFGQLENAIGNMEVKMDGDKTVGAIAPKMNKALGTQMRRSRRGN